MIPKETAVVPLDEGDEDPGCGRCPGCVGDPSDGTGAWWSCLPSRPVEDVDLDESW